MKKLLLSVAVLLLTAVVVARMAHAPSQSISVTARSFCEAAIRAGVPHESWNQLC